MSETTIKNFLNENLSDLIKCPIHQMVFHKPVLLSDGFTYEMSSCTEFMKRNLRSPMNRMKIKNKLYNIGKVKEFIDFCDKYELSVSNDKFFDIKEIDAGNLEYLMVLITTLDKELIFKINNFKLNSILDNDFFLNKLLQITVQKKDKPTFIEIFKYIISKSDLNCDFLNSNIFKICFSNTESFVFEYLFEQILEKVNNSLTLLQNHFNSGASNYLNGQLTYLINFLNSKKIQLNLSPQCILKLLNNNCPHIINILNYNIIEYNFTFSDGNNLLFKAIQYVNIPVVNYLLENKLLPHNSKNNFNRTILHEACATGNSDLIKNIIKYESNLNEITINEEWTPFHYACHNCNQETIEFLLNYPVNLNKVTKMVSGRPCNYLPINFIEINGNLSDSSKEFLISSMIEIMEIQQIEEEFLNQETENMQITNLFASTDDIEIKDMNIN